VSQAPKDAFSPFYTYSGCKKPNGVLGTSTTNPLKEIFIFVDIGVQQNGIQGCLYIVGVYINGYRLIDDGIRGIGMTTKESVDIANHLFFVPKPTM